MQSDLRRLLNRLLDSNVSMANSSFTSSSSPDGRLTSMMGEMECQFVVCQLLLALWYCHSSGCINLIRFCAKSADNRDHS